MPQIQRKNKLTREELISLMALRGVAWEASGVKFKNLSNSNSMLSDELDACEAVEHALLYDGDKLIGAGRISFHQELFELGDAQKYYSDYSEQSLKYAQLSRLVVHPSHWNRGLSRMLIDERIRCAKDRDVEVILTNVVGQTRKDSFLKLGFDVISSFDNDYELESQEGLNFYGMEKVILPTQQPAQQRAALSY